MIPPQNDQAGATGTPGSPFLTDVSLIANRVQPGAYPFTLPVLTQNFSLRFSKPVTFFVGENGSGKSTILEALAWSSGFSPVGGNRDRPFEEGVDGHALGRAFHLTWRQRSRVDGFFLRAETFHQFSTYLDNAGSSWRRYGGQSLHTRSHGEAFLALFEHRFEDGLYLLDEPEAALSPQRQLAFLRILHSLASRGIAQFVIATHSPILLCLPGATVLGFEGDRIQPIDYRDSEHFQLTRDFLNGPDRYLRHLLTDDG